MRAFVIRRLLIVAAGAMLETLVALAIGYALLHTIIHTTRESTTLFGYAGVLFALSAVMLIFIAILILVARRKSVHRYQH